MLAALGCYAPHLRTGCGTLEARICLIKGYLFQMCAITLAIVPLQRPTNMSIPKMIVGIAKLNAITAWAGADHHFCMPLGRFSMLRGVNAPRASDGAPAFSFHISASSSAAL